MHKQKLQPNTMQNLLQAPYLSLRSKEIGNFVYISVLVIALLFGFAALLDRQTTPLSWLALGFGVMSLFAWHLHSKNYFQQAANAYTVNSVCFVIGLETLTGFDIHTEILFLPLVMNIWILMQPRYAERWTIAVLIFYILCIICSIAPPPIPVIVALSTRPKIEVLLIFATVMPVIIGIRYFVKSLKKSEIEAVHAQNNLSVALNMLPVGIIIGNTETESNQQLVINQRLRTMLAFQTEDNSTEVVNLRDYCIDPELYDSFFQRFLENHDKPLSHEFQLNASDGSRLSIMATIQNIVLDSKNCYLLSINDISDIERAQSRLSEQFIQSQIILENIGANVWIIDSHYALLNFNSTFEKSMYENVGIKPTIGETYLDRLSNEEKNDWQEIYEIVLGGKQHSVISYTGENINEGKVFFTVGTPVKNQEEEIVGAVFMLRDFTEFYQMQEKLKLQQVQMNSILNASSDVIWSVDLSYHLTFFNSQFEYWCDKYTEKKPTPGMNLQEFQKDNTLWQNRYKRAFSGERHIEIQEFTFPDLKTFVELSLFPIYNEAQSCIGVVGFARDVTERIKQEQQSEDAQLILEQEISKRTLELLTITDELSEEIERRKVVEKELANSLEQQFKISEMKSKFVSMLSHEFRTPLTRILASSSLLHASYRDGKNLEESVVQRILLNVELGVKDITKILDSINHLLEIQTSISKESLKIISIDILKNMVCEIAANENISNRFVVEQRIAGHVFGVRRHFYLIFSELLDNAIQYSDVKDNIECSIFSREFRVFICISNIGEQIPTEEISLIFQLFRRGKLNDEIGKKRGLGLGLGIAQMCLEAMHGSIEYNYSNGRNNFCISIPLTNHIVEIPNIFSSN